MRRWLDAVAMIAAISGTAITPLITADQNRSRMGEIGRKVKSVPSTVATARTP